MTYVTIRMPENARTYFGHGFNLSVVGAANRLFGLTPPASAWLERAVVDPDLALGLAFAGRGAVLGLVSVGLYRFRNDELPDRAFGVLIPGMLLLCPLTWLHAIPLMILPIAVMIREEVGCGRSARTVGLVSSAAALCLNDRWLATGWVSTFGPPVPWPVNLVLLAPTWGTFGVLVLAATRNHRMHRGEAEYGATGPASADSDLPGHLPAELPEPAAK